MPERSTELPFANALNYFDLHAAALTGYITTNLEFKKTTN